MKRLWAPWRIKYIEKNSKEKKAPCIFCEKPKENRDRDDLILFRGKQSFVIMNIYPYNSGHLMVAPYNHLDSLEKLRNEELLDMMEITKLSLKIVREVFSPDGFNLGLNIGKAAGAGIEGHVHLHIVPRWNGDTNFMPIIGDTKVMPEDLYSMYDKLLPYFKNSKLD